MEILCSFIVFVVGTINPYANNNVTQNQKYAGNVQTKNFECKRELGAGILERKLGQTVPKYGNLAINDG